MEFTKEQQEYVDKLIEEKTKDLFTKDDLDKEVTREVDRRVESGIQKGLDTHKSKWQKEFEEQSKLTAEELADKKLNEKMKEIQEKEEELFLKANTLDAKSMLANAEIPKEHYEKFVGILVDGDEEKTKTNVENFISTFNETKAEMEKSIKKEYSNIPSPKNSGKGGSGITKEDFKSMGYLEQVELKQTNRKLYDELSKN